MPRLTTLLSVIALIALATLSLMACEIVPDDPPTKAEREFQELADPARGIWSDTIELWEETAARDNPLLMEPAAYAATRGMDAAILVWDSIEPPPEFRSYYLHYREAMEHERNTFKVLEEYYQLGTKVAWDPARADQIKDLVVRYGRLKDIELGSANDSLSD